MTSCNEQILMCFYQTMCILNVKFDVLKNISCKDQLLIFEAISFIAFCFF